MALPLVDVRSTLRLRPATEEDWRTVGPLMEVLGAELTLAHRSFSVALDDPSETLTIATLAGAVVGYVWVSPADGYLRELVTDARWRRFGIGRTLFEHACAQGRAAGRSSLRFHTGAAALPFYRALAPDLRVIRSGDAFAATVPLSATATRRRAA